MWRRQCCTIQHSHTHAVQHATACSASLIHHLTHCPAPSPSAKANWVRPSPSCSQPAAAGHTQPSHAGVNTTPHHTTPHHTTWTCTRAQQNPATSESIFSCCLKGITFDTVKLGEKHQHQHQHHRQCSSLHTVLLPRRLTTGITTTALQPFRVTRH